MTVSAPPSLARSVRRQLGVTAAGVLAAVVLVLLVGAAAQRLWLSDPRPMALLSYLAVWVPLLGAVLIGASAGGGGTIRDFGLRFRPLDLFWGLSVGLLARVAASLIEIAGYGRMGSAGPTLGSPVHDGWWLFAALLAPVLIAPFIEELFFRGMLLRTVERTTRVGGAGRPVSLGIAVGVSAAVFALVHVVQAESTTTVVVVGLSTFVFGVGVGSVAAATGRIGGAVVAHVTFNALVVIPVILAQA